MGFSFLFRLTLLIGGVAFFGLHGILFLLNAGRTGIDAIIENRLTHTIVFRV